MLATYGASDHVARRAEMGEDEIIFPEEFTEEDDTPVGVDEAPVFSEAVLYSSDWTVETIIGQLQRKNIDINPRFQRRDAWDRKKKSRFIESVILGLPIPQLVLAEKKGERGRYIVIDGKQRLLSLLQYTGSDDVEGGGFGLSGLDVRTDLARKRYRNLTTDAELHDDLDAFLNYTIRAVVIRNWPDTEFLHLVFLRLNTGSVKLSQQELRQALFPGAFSDFIDDRSAGSAPLQTLLGRTSPDPRMRDVELLIRYLAFHLFIDDYPGRLLPFLDRATDVLNCEWEDREAQVASALDEFDAAATTIITVFGARDAARKPGSGSFNRAIFDALVFYASDPQIRDQMTADPAALAAAYQRTLANERFIQAVERDTAGAANTHARLDIWGSELRKAIKLDFMVPAFDAQTNRIRFSGFWV